MTPESLVRHELAGLDVDVVEATDPGLVGTAGRVVDETRNTLLVATGESRARRVQVPKAEATFRFAVEDTGVVVDGERLVADPARRTEAKRGKLWQ